MFVTITRIIYRILVSIQNCCFLLSLPSLIISTIVKKNNYTMSHDGAWTLARSMKRNKMLRERVMDNNRGGVAEKVTEPIPTFHLHNTHYNTFIYFIFKDNYFSSVIVHFPRLILSNYRHFSGNDIRYTKISEKIKRISSIIRYIRKYINLSTCVFNY